ncbi:MAG: ComEC/Rec2 family competence protein [Bacteroidales bacterium]|nr:ComEC/Rec2 family competence protein [Bacteroidales bacterium]
MKTASIGMVPLSFSLAAGTAFAAAVSRPFESALAGSILAAATLVFCAASPRRDRAAMCTLFFCLGMLGWCRDALAPSQWDIGASAAMDSIEKRIYALGLAGEHSPDILKALLTGRRDSLDRGTTEAFRRSGASHILALSGLHLGIIYGCMRKLLSPAGNSRAARIAGACIITALCGLYTAGTGAAPSTVRAFLFIAVNECSHLLCGRIRRPIGTFCLALTIQLAVSPGIISSAGFQLSYLAMLGIIVLNPPLSAWYRGFGGADPLRYIWKCASLSISCQLFTAPVAWWHFRSLPAYFLITNLTALPLTSMIMATALASLALDAAGLCPRALVTLCGTLIQTLEFCLETIASL